MANGIGSTDGPSALSHQPSAIRRSQRLHELSNVPDLLDRLDQLERATDALRGEHEARAVGELLVQLRARERTVRSTAIAFVRRLRQLAAVDQIHLDEAAHLVEAAGFDVA